MKIVETYSHLNGLEYLIVHKPALWKEVQQAINAVDAALLPPKFSKEKGKAGRKLYAPKEMNAALGREFDLKGWKKDRTDFYTTGNAEVLRQTLQLSSADQKVMIQSKGLLASHSYNETDFVKERVAVEVQFGKYFSVSYDIFVKHVSFYVADIIDVGVEIVPMKELMQSMSSGVPWYEIELRRIVQQGRAAPPVPLVLVGVAP